MLQELVASFGLLLEVLMGVDKRKQDSKEICLFSNILLRLYHCLGHFVCVCTSSYDETEL